MLSPLRYPGGKAKLFPFFVNLTCLNKFYGKIYAEPYAGGAGLALKLLSHGYVSRIELNDVDVAIASFWRSIISDTDKFCSMIREVEISVAEWRRQRAIYAQGENVSDLELGFAAYFLNRTSRSGIIEGSGPIGGYLQTGAWLIDARFNRDAQISQIQEIARFSSNISISCQDAMQFVKRRISDDRYFIYLDPPYYDKGQKLYKNFYSHSDHKFISEFLIKAREGNWILSYDYVPEIVDLYKPLVPTIYSLQYSAGKNSAGMEVIYTSDSIQIPKFPGFELAA